MLTAAMLRPGRIKGSSSGTFISHPERPERLWNTLSPLFNGYSVLSRGQIGRRMKSTTHLHLVKRLRIRGAIPVLPLYAFMTWSGRTLTPCIHCVDKGGTAKSCHDNAAREGICSHM